MSLPALWCWLQTLQVNDHVPKVNGFINYRGQVLYARLVYITGVIRVIAKSTNSNLEIYVNSEPNDSSVELELLRIEVKQLIETYLMKFLKN
jgi:hypothetical protein